MMRAQSPAGMRPPWRSRPSWFFRVQMTASTRWRSQFGNGRGCFSSLRAGRIRVSPSLSPAKNSSVPCPDRPLSVTTAVPGAGRFAGWRSRVCRAWSRSPCSLGFARLNPVTVPSQDLRHGQAGELGVGDVRRPSRPAAAGPAQRDDPVGQFHVECGQEGVQVGDHDGLQGPDVCENADPGHSSLTGHAPPAACRRPRLPPATNYRSTI